MQIFPTTLWTVILKAREGNPAEVNRLFGTYHPAVVRYLCTRGYREIDAEDMTQEVFQFFLEGDLLAKADRAKGRFRSLVISVTKHILMRRVEREQAKKRGEGKPVESLEGTRGEGEFKLEDVVASRERDEPFDMAWTHRLVSVALQAIEERCKREGKLHFEALKAHLESEGSYENVAAGLQIKSSDVHNLITQARKWLAEEIQGLIRNYSSSAEEYADEVRYLMGFLK